MKINVVKSILDANDTIAEAIRSELTAAGVRVLNVTSAPGSGKTSLLVETLRALEGKRKAAVIVGDLQTSRDAERLCAFDAPVTQINTEGGCHLSAAMVRQALGQIDVQGLDLLFIENVGNMVCPAGFDLGEHARVAMLSVPEGDDKVAKYPTLFQPADVILLNKIDLAELLEFDRRKVYDDLSRINTRAPVIEMSVRTGEGVDQWLNWLGSLKPGEATP